MWTATARWTALTTTAMALSLASHALAGPGDPPVSFLVQQTAPGEVAQTFCDPVTRFFVVDFLLNGVLVSQLESGTACDPNVVGGGLGKTDGGAAAEQLLSSLQTFIPGLNGNSDLKSVLRIPDHRPGLIDLSAAAKKICADRVKELEELLDEKVQERQLLQNTGTLFRIAESNPNAQEFQLVGLVVKLLADIPQLAEGLTPDARALLRAAEQDRAEIDTAAAHSEVIFTNFNAIDELDANREEKTKDAERVEAEAAARFNAVLDRQARERSDLARGLDLLDAASASPDQAERRREAFEALETEQQNDPALSEARGEFDGSQGFRSEREDDRLEARSLAVEASASKERLDATVEGNGLERFLPLLDLIPDLQKDIEDRLTATEEELADIERRLAIEKERCKGAGIDVSDAFSFSGRSGAWESAANAQAAIHGNIPLENGLSSLSGGDSGFNWSFAADPEVTLFVSGDVTFQRDNRGTQGQDGETFAVAGGASLHVSPDLTVGAVGRYGRTDLSGRSGSTSANTFSLGGFAQALLPEDISLTIVAAYSLSDIDAEFVQNGVTTPGKTDADSISVQANLAKSFAVDDFTITPVASISHTWLQQDAFTLSNGTAAPERTVNQTTASAGVGVAKRIVIDQDWTTTPSLSVSGFANLSGNDALLQSDGTRIETGTFGAALQGGFSFESDTGVVGGVSTGFSYFGDGQIGYSVSGNISIPLN